MTALKGSGGLVCVSMEAGWWYRSRLRTSVFVGDDIDFAFLCYVSAYFCVDYTSYLTPVVYAIELYELPKDNPMATLCVGSFCALIFGGALVAAGLSWPSRKSGGSSFVGGVEVLEATVRVPVNVPASRTSFSRLRNFGAPRKS